MRPRIFLMNIWGIMQAIHSSVRGCKHGLRLEHGAKVRVRRGRIIAGNRVHVGKNTLIAVVGNESAATLQIGDNTRIGAQCVINVACGITIGKGCELSWRVQLLDTDFHSVTYANGSRSVPAKPIRIGNSVLIGTGALILKGVTIGDGAVIGAGAVVTRDVPAHTIASGNPAVIGKNILDWK